jgi:hypothetical protein
MIEIVLINSSISDSLWQSADKVQLKIAIDKTVKNKTTQKTKLTKLVTIGF